MAQYRIPDPEDLLECPYDRVHMVRAKRFQYHLMKCRKNYTGKDFVSCPFNAKHEMPRPELRHHIANCPDKAVMEPELAYNSRKEQGDEGMLKGCTDTPVYNDMEIESTEDWDAEASVPVRVGPMYDQLYYSRVKFHDPTALNKQQRKVLKDNRLTPEQKMEELRLSSGQRIKESVSAGGDSLRLPKTSSKAAMPTVQPVQQPQSSVFAYSVCGRGRGRGMVTNGAVSVPFTPVQPVGMGRGLVAPGGLMQSSVRPAPGFCVPNINQH